MHLFKVVVYTPAALKPGKWIARTYFVMEAKETGAIEKVREIEVAFGSGAVVCVNTCENAIAWTAEAEVSFEEMVAARSGADLLIVQGAKFPLGMATKHWVAEIDASEYLATQSGAALSAG